VIIVFGSISFYQFLSVFYFYILFSDVFRGCTSDVDLFHRLAFVLILKTNFHLHISDHVPSSLSVPAGSGVVTAVQTYITAHVIAI